MLLVSSSTVVEVVVTTVLFTFVGVGRGREGRGRLAGVGVPGVFADVADDETGAVVAGDVGKGVEIVPLTTAAMVSEIAKTDRIPL